MIPWHQYIMGLLLVLAGMNHFRKPKLYERIIPPYIPAASTMVMASGILEMVLGFMLMNQNTQVQAAWGIIIMLILFIPVHIYMLQDKKASMKLPTWLLILRVPLQFALMYWAFLYT
ncbi:MAG TPA: MauE/DoxX family redox-associated membrane protein [Aequorivita sp.]|nr:MauE/DoxX family redox-associated membrane protein [Aequorivita sp.]